MHWIRQMQESTITARGQTTVPRDIRAALNLRPGDRLRYLLLDDGEVRLMRSRPAMELAGLLKGRGRRGVSLQDMEDAIAGGASRK
ncbi:type II toxin-antitoxin system PrlF family antitoxin [Paracoccus indicus]|uniref:type II toxin-antitoxin system PrlF family antitoxin n=1 Tax=Paracoccus indicus TaxID=2079229 RepID=UPI001FE54F66|nr:type II toxin-antitoxin system PrlF family antitoxin [Paracoccus indicus]